MKKLMLACMLISCTVQSHGNPRYPYITVAWAVQIPPGYTRLACATAQAATGIACMAIGGYHIPDKEFPSFGVYFGGLLLALSAAVGA